MDHGLSIERRVREGLLEIGRKLGIPPLATNDCHYVTREAAHNHEALLCVQTGKTLSDPTRFKFDGDGYYLKSAAEMREMWDDQVPGACDSTLLIAERVQSYADVWTPRDRMPVFPVPDGHDQASWLRHEVQPGWSAGSRPACRSEYTDRADYEIKVICDKGFPSYFLIVGGPDQLRPVGRHPGGAGPRLGGGVAGGLRAAASPTSTRFRTGCCSSASSTPSARPRPISTSTSTTAAAVRWCGTPRTSGAATGSPRSSPSAPSRPKRR